MGEQISMGIDLGGTKIEIVALDAQGAELLRHRVNTPQGDYAGTLEAIRGLVVLAESEAGCTGTVGIGTPGAISPATGLLKNSNSVCLNGMPLKEDLEHELGREVRIANDANCFALSEAVDGAAKGADIVFGVIIGTGTGAGIVVRQHVLTGPNAITGEWGHNPLPWPEDSENNRLKQEGGGIYFVGIKSSIYEFIARTCFVSKIGNDHFFDSKKDALRSIYQRLDKTRCEACDKRIFRECQAEFGQR